MNFQFCNIDPYKATKAELEEEIARLNILMHDASNTQQALKIFINSAYGAIGNQFFQCYNPDVAEAITLQGQNIIKFMNEAINKYFHSKWHLDKELHTKLGIKVNNPIQETVTVYGDTDSIHGDSLVNLPNGKISISELWNSFSKIEDVFIDSKGIEIIKTPIFYTMNYNDVGSLYKAKVSKIVRHRVSKAKWLLETASGRKIIVTNDHSMIVFRDGNKYTVKPSEIQHGDRVLVLENDMSIGLGYFFDLVYDCENIGTFNEEYVYNLEMEDYTHTFIANDILVHNSLYISFDEVFSTIDGFITEGRNYIDMIRLIYEHRLKDYFKGVQKIYASKFNTEDIQVFEMEKICNSGIWLAKKKYVVNVAWEDSGVDGIYFDKTNLVSKGIETVQSSNPKFVRDVLDDILNYIFEMGKNKITSAKITKKLKLAKSTFLLANPEDISMLKAISDYDKYVINDRGAVEVASKCPFYTRSAAVYNFMVNSKKEWKEKYNLIKSGDKIKYYYVKDASKTSNAFGFLPGNFPVEFAPEYDYDTMFSKMILEPINRILNALSLQEIPSSLIVYNVLF